jgi:hypothetical protein
MIKVNWIPIFTEELSQDGNITYYEPEPAFKYLVNTRGQPDYLRCPGLTNYLKNTFIIRSPYDLSIIVDAAGNVTTDRFGQDFFNQNISVRPPTSPKDNLIIQSFPKYLFVSDSKKPVVVSVIPWMFKANPFGIVPGSFDITQWVRPVNLAMEVYQPGPIVFKRGEPLYAVRFEVDDTVTLERGEYTPDIGKAMVSCLNVQNYVPGLNLKSLYTAGKHYITMMKRKYYG